MDDAALAALEQALATARADGDRLHDLLAVERSRRSRAESRASVLAGLSLRLAGAPDRETLSRVLADALPEVLSADASAVWLWHAEDGEVRAAATAGLTPELDEGLRGIQVRPAEVPELAELLTRREPLVLNAGQVTPVLDSMLAALGLEAAIGVALLSGDRLLGAVTASWADKRLEGEALQETTLRLLGVAAHAATALHNAELVEATRHQALHDPLTGLANRRLFHERLEQALRVGPPGQTAVLVCDLDQFKQLNDEHGHASGDEVLRQVAGRLTETAGTGATVARLGGDEFALVLPPTATPAQALLAAERLVDALAEPVRVEGHRLFVTMSVGVALDAGGPDRASALLRGADRAMYASKRRGRNQVSAAWSAHPDGGVPVALFAEELAAAAGAGQLLLHLQPLFSVDGTGDPVAVGAEALVRWQHPRLGVLPPGAFLLVAEQEGSVIDVDLWVLRAACAQAAGWSDDVSTVAVNLSVRTLSDPRLHEAVRTTLVETGLAPSRLFLEVVESRALLDLPRVAERLDALRHLGVRIALDDFGTGFSSLSWLQQLPVDAIKVDRSITLESAGGPQRSRVALALLRGVVLMGRELGVAVVAEGVETQEQLDAVREAGCRVVQGNLLGRPDAPEAMATLLAENGKVPAPRSLP